MNISLLRARQWSLALLLTGLLNSEHLLANHAGTVPQSAGLLRLGRDLMRRTGGSEAADKTETAEGAAPTLANLAVHHAESHVRVLAAYHSPPDLTSRSSTTFLTPGIFLTRRFMAMTSQ